jgi:hypothetical protein
MKLAKLKIAAGDDMLPSIDPNEYLLLDEDVQPQAGDVILFENRFGLLIAHRLLYITRNYCFTKGDNCIVFNYPEKRTSIKGVIVGKSNPVYIPLHLKIVLRIFLCYFKVSPVRHKKRSRLLKLISKYLSPKSLTVYRDFTLPTYEQY